MMDGAAEQRWQEGKAGRIIESHQLGLMQMIGLLQGASIHAEAVTAA